MSLLGASFDMKSILAKAFYGRANLGDDAILARLMQWVAGTPHRITVATGPSESALDEILESYGLKNTAHIADSFWPVLFHLLRTDVLLLGGGGLFPSDAPRQLISRFVLILAARVLGRQVVLLGLGINPVSNRLSKLMWRGIMWAADLVNASGITCASA